jgi:tetratricopeptide (TPR) repeat protein
MNNIIASISDRIVERRISRLTEKGEFEEARNILRKRNLSKQDDLWLLTSLAVLYQLEGDTDQVLQISREIDTYPSVDEDAHALARWRIARLLKQMGSNEEALSHLLFCVDHWPDNPRVLTLKASILIALEQETDALNTFERVLEIDARNQEAIFGLIDLYWDMGEGDQAEKYIQKYLEKNPDFVLSHFLMALHVYYVEGDPSTSLKYFEDALRLLPSSWSNRILEYHRINPGLKERIIGEYIKALLDCGIDHAAKAMIQETRRGDLYRSLWTYYYTRLEDWDSAIKWAKQGLSKNPDFYNLRFSLGVLYIRTGKLEEAEGELLDALRAAKKNFDVAPDRMANLVVLYHLLENPEKEQEYLQISLSLNAEITYLNFASLYNDLEIWDEALTAVTKALEIDPEWLMALHELAKAQLGSGKHQEAIDTYKVLLERQPNNGMLWLGISQGYAYLNDEGNAVKAARKAIDTGNLSSIQKAKAVELS